MSRKRSGAKTEADILEPEQAQLPARARKNPSAPDPREPLSIGAVREEQALLPPEVPRRKAEDIASRYARALMANQGDVVKALAIVFGVSEDEATQRMVELHEQARGATRANTSVGDMIERHDLSIEMRVARMRQIVYGVNDAAALKAIDVLNEMDASSKTKRIGTTWEALVKRVRDKAAAGLAKK